MKQFDYIVLGSGIAGPDLRAQRCRARARCHHHPRKNRAESNTNYAQGGIAMAVTSKEDSVEIHVRDTLEAGARAYARNPSSAPSFRGRSRARIAELIELGMKFSEREIPRSHGARELDLGKEGGHSKRRILHAKDVTGREIERALLAAIAAQPQIEIFENHFAIDLITTQKLGYVPVRIAASALTSSDKDQPVIKVETFVAPRRCCWPRVVAARFIFTPPIRTSRPATA